MKKTQKGDKTFITVLGVLLVAGVAVIGYMMYRPKAAPVVIAANAPLPEPKGVVAGSDSAPVEIVEFGDFECPVCGRFATITEPDVRRLLVNTGAARFRFIDFPLPGHPSTRFAHYAAACANEQSPLKFWELHDRIFYGQTEWSALANGRDMNAPKIMKRYAKEVGLDAKTFGDCLDSQKYETQLRANYKEGERLGVNATPTFFVGKRRIEGPQPYDVIKAMVDSATIEAKKGPPVEKALGDTASKKRTSTPK